MFLTRLLIYNYRSCRNLDIQFEKDLPNVFIGINDCGKTTILKAIGLLLEEKSTYFSIKDNSSKKDFSNSPISDAELSASLSNLGLPQLPYTRNQTVIIGQFISEDDDIDETLSATYTPQLLWTLENSKTNEVWLAKTFESDSNASSTFLLTPDSVEDSNQSLSAWDLASLKLDKLIKDLEITPEEIKNSNRQGRFSNMEKIRAIYSKKKLQPIWLTYKIEKGDKSVFPSFRYLDWNASLEEVKKTASDAMAATIDAQLKPLKVQALEAAQITEANINSQLETLKGPISQLMPTITGIKAKVFFDVKESVTDILINKSNADSDIHLDLQGEGIKRQIWFALIKSGAEASIKSGMRNKRFIWAFDEPETHLYPSAQREFFEVIKDVSSANVQTIICTHSTIFIDKSKIKNIKSVMIGEHAYTSIAHCSSPDEVFKTLELKNSDFLFYDRFLVTEGDTEAVLIPEFYKLYKGHYLEEDNIQLINLKGKDKWLVNKTALENVLKDFKKSFDFVIYLFDADMQRGLGAGAINSNFFFIGNQDIEDAIASEIWTKFVTKVTDGAVNITVDEIEALKSTIPADVPQRNEEKFLPKLERVVKEKLTQANGEQVTWSVLPTKGTDYALILNSLFNDVSQIPVQICAAFAKLCKE
jgi:putative ATP-dependent endonuclease of the OLD family